MFAVVMLIVKANSTLTGPRLQLGSKRMLSDPGFRAVSFLT